jgi:hypothetical protein
LDVGLTVLDTESDNIYVCSAEPTTYTEAITTFKLGVKSFTRGTVFGSVGAGSPDGRQVTSVAITDGSVTDPGTVGYWAVVDSTNTRLLARGVLTGGGSVTAGQGFTLAAITIQMPATASGGGSGIAPTINATTAGSASSASLVPSVGFDISADSVLAAFIFHSRVDGDGSVTTVDTVDDTIALGGWQRRGTQKSFQSDGPGTPWCALDVFWTYSASAQTLAVTAHLAAAADDLGIIVIAVNGCGNTSDPWDANGSLPASISDLTAGLGTDSIPTVTGVSTTAPGTLLCMFATNANSAGTPTSQTSGAGFTAIHNQPSSGGNNYSWGALQTGPFATSQSGRTAAFGESWNGWIALVDALVGT